MIKFLSRFLSFDKTSQADHSQITSSDLYFQAKDLANCLYKFPYMEPSATPSSVKKDKELMRIIADTHRTTISPGGGTQQTTISAAERIRLQAEFKERIYTLLESCIANDPDHGPAFLLYPIVAGFNTRAKDRPAIIALYERFRTGVDRIEKGTRAYDLIAYDIRHIVAGKNQLHKVERHLADFYYEMAILYHDEKKPILAIVGLDIFDVPVGRADTDGELSHDYG